MRSFAAGIVGTGGGIVGVVAEVVCVEGCGVFVFFVLFVFFQDSFEIRSSS